MSFRQIFCCVLLLISYSFAMAKPQKALEPSSSVIPAVTQKVTGSSSNIIPAYDMNKYDQVIANIYQSIPGGNATNIATRVAAISKQFIGKPYLLGALGEGPNGKYDQEPLYRTDAFDCVTYVSTVLAIAESNDLEQFKKNITRIRYQDNNVSYVDRNHFMSVDWNQINAYNGYVRDITYKFTDGQGKPVASIANTTINKPAWYQHLQANNIKQLGNIDTDKKNMLLQELHNEGDKTQQEKAVTLYLPLKSLFHKGKADMVIFDQIPTGSIIEVVRPNWNLKDKIGTNMNISHLGFAIRIGDTLMFREASMTHKKVIDIPLKEYLKNYLKSKTVKGINVQLTTHAAHE